VSAPARPKRRLGILVAPGHLWIIEEVPVLQFVRGIVSEITELVTTGFSAPWSFRKFGGESSFRRNAWDSLFWTGGFRLTCHVTWRVNQGQYDAEGRYHSNSHSLPPVRNLAQIKDLDALNLGEKFQFQTEKRGGRL